MAGSKPAWAWHLLFPANTYETSSTMKSVQGSWIPNCTHPPTPIVYPVRTCTFWPYRTVLGSFRTSSRSPMHLRAVATTSNEHFCGVKFSWIRFLHYTLCGPPWHLIQAIITSEEWYKRDLTLKAFLWYLTAAHHTHSEWKGLKTKENYLKTPCPCQRLLIYSDAELRNVTAVLMGALAVVMLIPVLDPREHDGQHWWGKAGNTFTVIAISIGFRNNTLLHLRFAN